MATYVWAMGTENCEAYTVPTTLGLQSVQFVHFITVHSSCVVPLALPRMSGGSCIEEACTDGLYYTQTNVVRVS